MSLKAILMEAIKASMKAGDKSRLVVLRGFSAAIKQRQVDERIELKDADVLAIVDKQIKQHRDSEQQFHNAERLDLTDKEAFKIGVLSESLPKQKQLGETALIAIIDAAIFKVSDAGMALMKRIMVLVKPQIQDRVSYLVKAKLS